MLRKWVLMLRKCIRKILIEQSSIDLKYFIFRVALKYACLCMHVYVSVHVHVVFMCMCECMCMSTWVPLHVGAHIHVHAPVHVCKHVHVHVCL